MPNNFESLCISPLYLLPASLPGTVEAAFLPLAYRTIPGLSIFTYRLSVLNLAPEYLSSPGYSLIIT